MADQLPPTPRPSKWSAFKRTGASFIVKLVIVAAGVGAYYALNSMERSKSNFDKTKSAPLVIVDVPQKEKSRDIIELSAADVKKFFDNYEGKEDLEKLKAYIDRLKYQSLKNSDELLDRINQEVLKDEAAAERASEQQRDFLEKQFAARKAALFEKCPLPEESTLPTVATNNKATAKPPVIKPCPQTPRPTCADIENQYSCWRTNYAAQKGQLEVKDSEVRKNREKQIKAFYEHVRPKLIARVEDEKKARQAKSFAFLFPKDVLDDGNGIHVIFSIFWLTCMVILVFGVLYVILLLLRPVPPFASGSQALSERAKDFLARRSATPQLARTLIATTAALGIGSAVAVAGGMNMPGSAGRTNLESAQVSYNTGDTSNRIVQTSKPPVINVTVPPTTPVLVPYPDNSRIDGFARELGQFGGNVDTLTQNLNTLKSQVDSTLQGIDSAMDQKVRPLGVRLDSVGDGLADTRDDLAYTKAEVQALKDQATTLRVEFLTRIDGLNTSVKDLRNDYFSQSRTPGNRNFVAKIFKPGSERYLVTNQSILALTHLMCTKARKDPNPQATTDQPAASCTWDSECDCKGNSLLKKLQDMVVAGAAPMTEAQLSSALSTDAAWKVWKGVILRYTRVI